MLAAVANAFAQISQMKFLFFVCVNLCLANTNFRANLKNDRRNILKLGTKCICARGLTPFRIHRTQNVFRHPINVWPRDWLAAISARISANTAGNGTAGPRWANAVSYGFVATLCFC